jgi:hypothetical protein
VYFPLRVVAWWCSRIVLVLHDRVVAQRYEQEWDRLWSESEEMKGGLEVLW